MQGGFAVRVCSAIPRYIDIGDLACVFHETIGKCFHILYYHYCNCTCKCVSLYIENCEYRASPICVMVYCKR